MGDAHRSVTVKHRSRVAANPSQPNLRQVHPIHSELLDEFAGKGFAVKPGDFGHNILTAGIDFLNLPRESILKIGETRLRVTGLRNPCKQLNDFASGLMSAMLDHAADVSLIRKAGVMAVVERGATIKVGDPVFFELPAPPRFHLSPVQPAMTD